jgi:hypothetical protein
VDLLDLWRDKISVRKVLNLVDRLPSGSQYISAIVDDEDLADAVDAAAQSTPSVSEWSPTVAALAVIADRLATLINVQVARGGGKPGQVDPYPRPVTAAQRVRGRRRMERHQRLVSLLLPGDDASSGKP